MRGSPWDPAGDADAGEYKTAAPEPHQEPLRGGLYTERAVSLREFWEKKGKTSGCTACLVSGSPFLPHDLARPPVGGRCGTIARGQNRPPVVE